MNMSVFPWIIQQIPVSTATQPAAYGRGLQEIVWRNLAEYGPATVHDLAERLADDHQRVRNTLYRLASLGVVRCAARVPSPMMSSTPRVVWCVVDRSGQVKTTAMIAPVRRTAGSP